MSAVLCAICDRLVNSDDDLDGFYVTGYNDKFVCEFCRDGLGSTLDSEEDSNETPV